MTDPSRDGLGRRRFLAVGGMVSAGTLLAACTSNEPKGSNSDSGQQAGGGNNANAAPGATVTIGFSAPQADHGWISAISKNAEAQAKRYQDVKFQPVEATNEVTR